MAKRAKRGQASPRTIQRAKAVRNRERVARDGLISHPTNSWSKDDWQALGRAAKRKHLQIDVSLAPPRGPVRLMAPRVNGAAICVLASTDLRELMRRLR